MNRRGHVFGHRAHFDCQNAFGDQLACADPADPHPEDAAGFGIEYQLRQAVVAPERRGTTGGRPGKSGDSHRLSGALGRLFRQSAPGDFRIREDDGWNRGFKRRLPTGDHTGGDQSLMRGLVREHRFAHHIADGEDGRLGRAHLSIDLDEALR